MLYITEMDFDDPSRLEEWHAFYLRNIANLQSVPGFLASQRFEAVVDTIGRFTALHEIESAAVFDSGIYRERGGRQSNGHWQRSMVNWHRNLYSGIDRVPEVPDGSLLVYFDVDRPTAERELPLPAHVYWLTLVGLDRTIEPRGIAITADAATYKRIAEADKRVKVFRPITPQIRTGRPMAAAA